MTSVLQKRYSLHNQLVSQQRLNNQLISQIEQIQALANIGLVSAMVAHEINNVLTPLQSYAQLALNYPDDKALTQKTLQKTAANSARASKILESMLALTDGRPQKRKIHRLKALVDEVFTCLARDFAKDRIKVTVDIAEEMTVRAEGISLQQVFMNLIINAREAMLPKGGFLTIRAKQLDATVQIEVRDTGCGIEQVNLKKIFEPFFSTKTSEPNSKQTGTGLGLALCKTVIDAHDGVISIESDLGRETTFRITLPK